VGQAFRYAIATGRTEHDITADLKGALQTAKENHYAYFNEKEFQEFLKDLAPLNTLRSLQTLVSIA
jgi:hypothetical protein